ncbi:MAG: 3-hydroxyacyl-CoA dehydrogenase family protein [Thermomicrobiales bacterium]
MSEGRIAVIGAGTMGSQIAQQAALHGYSVSLYDERPEQLARALESNRGHLQRRVEKGVLAPLEFDAALARVEPLDNLSDAVAGCSLVIEAIVEDLGAKQSLFQELDALTASDVMLATNTSSMTVTQITSILPGRDRTLALHFFNPVLVMQLVEIAAAPFSRAGLVQRAEEFVTSIGRVPVVLDKEIEGMLANRIIAAIRREAFWLVENGYATPEAIDQAIELGLRHPMGPFRLADFNGLDVVLAIQQRRFERTGDELDRPPARLKALVDEGKLGRKTGAGFYDYEASGERTS